LVILCPVLRKIWGIFKRTSLKICILLKMKYRGCSWA